MGMIARKLMVSVVLIHGIALSATVNELNKIFHHRTSSDKTAHVPQVELGQLVLYFAQDPIINSLPDATQKARHEVSFFFPMTSITSQAASMMAGVNNAAQSMYAIRMEQVDKPIKGIKCSFAFDPAKVTFEYSSFQSITLQKGLVFKFYNKTLLDQLSKQGKAMLRMAAAGKPAVVIDCGHGGCDAGKVGFFNLQEKDLTREVGLKVAQLLRAEGVHVFLTREDDSTIELDERTAFANATNAQLFVSIHANAAPNTNACGIETYCLTQSLFKPQSANLNVQQKACACTVAHHMYSKSEQLAALLQEHALESAKKKQQTVVDRRVKHSAAQVLMGAAMPSALIEIGFLSNEREAKLLSDEEYKLLIAQGISRGILAYFKS